MAPGHQKAASARSTKKSAAKKRPAAAKAVKAAKAKRPAGKKSTARPAATKVKWKADPQGATPETQRPVEPVAAPEPPRTPPPLPVPIATFVL